MENKTLNIIKWVFVIIGLACLALAGLANDRGGLIVMLIFAAAFGGIGGGLITYGKLSAKKEADLRQNGRLIQAEIHEVEVNEAVEVNGVSPYRVVARWLNTATNELFIFKSANLWFDPSEYLKGPTIPVFIDANNPLRYHVDLSGWPKVRS